MKNLNLLIKPVSSACNMSCNYCFYNDEAKKREINNYGIMSDETMGHIIKKAMDYAEESCIFGFQGGEPTLAGIDYFKRFVSLVEEYNKKKIAVQYCLQTNGIFYSGISKRRSIESFSKDRDWIEFLKKEKFLVGISLDGTKEIHDANRMDWNKKSTFLRVTRTIDAMLNNGVDVNVLTVLTRQSAPHVEKIYHFLKKMGVRYQQYIPCLDPLGEERGKETYSLTPQRFADAKKRLFDLWFSDLMVNDYVYIREFENWVGILKGYAPEECRMYGRCSMQNIIEANGDVFPCDFYVLDAYKVGNIEKENFMELHRKLECHPFFEKAEVRDWRCSGCRWYPICRGGCRRECEQGKVNYNYYCQSYQEIFSYVIERLEYLASRS